MNIAQIRARLAYRKGRELAWRAAGRTAHYWHNQKAIERARREILKWKALVAQAQAELAKAHPASLVTMYDTTDPGTSLPTQWPQAVAGYVGGNWPSYNALVKRYPNARHLSIAVNAGEDARCLDVETGDATPGEAPAWVRRQHARGVSRPVVYANTSTMPQVLRALSSNGIRRDEYLVWTAHYTGSAHIEPGSDATQYESIELPGRNYDASLCSPTFL